jgi:hypothetical protein
MQFRRWWCAQMHWRFILIEADENSQVVAIVYRYSKFALNWVLSMRHVGVENYVLVALDTRVHAYFTRLSVPSFHFPSLGKVRRHAESRAISLPNA